MGKPTLRTWAMLIATCISAPGSVLAQWTTNGTNIYNTNTGNVGICISSPVSKLEILQSGGGSGQNVGLKIWAGNTNTYFGNSQIQFSYGGGGYLHAIKSRHSSATLAGNSFDFFLWQPGDPINSEGSLNVMSLNGGLVGIGTSSPSAKLHVLDGAPASAQGLNSSTRLALDVATGGFHEFRSTADNNTFSGILFTDNNLGGYVTFRNYPDDKLHLGAYSGLAFEVGTDNNVGGKTERMQIDGNGNVGIGTSSPNQKLTVNGTIYGKEVKVDLNVPGPDYVFEKDYPLISLDDVRSYIQDHKHLPEVPSANQMEKEGISLGQMNMVLLKKVEELTLYILNQDKRIKALENQINSQK